MKVTRARGPRGESDGRRPGTPVILSLILACVAAAPGSPNPSPPSGAPEPTADTAVLELPNDGFLQGKLMPAGPAEGRGRTTVLWKSPLFEQPIEFRLDAIRRIRLAKQPAAMAAESWRVDLQGGDIVIGELDAIDADHVALRVPGLGERPLRLRRDAVVRLARPRADLKVIVPGDTAGWEGPRGAVRGQAGRIVVDKADAMVTLGGVAPPRACFEVRVSWDERPEFELHFALDPTRAKSGGKSPAADAKHESYRIEALADDMLAIREGATAKFDHIKTLAAAGSLQLHVFVDQERGRLALVAADGPAAGKLLFDETLPPRQPTSHGGLGVRVRKGNLRIDSLRVAAWKAEEPQFPKTADLGGPDAVVESFDRGKGMFVVRSGDAVRDVPAADVSAIEFPAPPPVPAPSAEPLLVAFHDGSRLTARLTEVTPSGLRLECRSLADPIEPGFAQVAVIEPLATSSIDVPGRPALLEAAGGRMLGHLGGPDGAASGIIWWPRGAVAPAAVSPAAAMRIRYRGFAAATKEKPADGEKADAPPATGPATVYLKTGDSIQCTVLSAGPDGARIKTDLEADKLVPAVAIRAIELLPSAAASIPKDKFARLLTLPRLQQSSPPTHMLRLTTGDYLRGKLVSLDENEAHFDVLGTVKEIPRSQSARLIWLSVAGDDSQKQAVALIMGSAEPGSVPVRATMNGGGRLSFSATRVEGDRLVGRNGVFGATSVDLARCDHLDLGHAAAEAETESIPYSQWQLKPAPLPRALRQP